MCQGARQQRGLGGRGLEYHTSKGFWPNASRKVRLQLRSSKNPVESTGFQTLCFHPRICLHEAYLEAPGVKVAKAQVNRW